MSNLLTSLSRRARSGFTLIEMTIVILIIGILCAIAIPSYLRCRENSEIRVCRSHLRHLQDAKERWAMENRKRSSDVPDIDDLVPAYLKEMPICPTNGHYKLGSVGENPTCDVPGHTMY